jgi:hypothetical protein
MVRFSFQGVVVQNQPASFSAVSSLTIPVCPSYQFSYSGYGMMYQTVASSAGGTGTITFDYPLGGEALYSGPTFTHRTESGTNSSGTVLNKVDTIYTNDPGGSKVVESLITTDDLGQQTKVDFDYDQYGNILNERNYGYKISGQWQVRRRTHNNYINWEPYLSTYIRDRVTETDVYEYQ